MLTCGLCTCGLITARAALLAAPGQTYPGQPTRANVWIENRSKSEAVPVVIQNGEGDAPIRVQLIGLPTVALSPATVVQLSPATIVQTRAIRQTWEYKEVTAPSVQRAIVALNAAGLEGWEPIASPVPTPDGMSWLLKRPR
jgi:hypothetical protein